MPLLRRQPFVRARPPPDIKHDDYVFYCKVSGEVFTDYEKFFERIILCNSLVWTCAYTGRSGLTFEEALESEKKAKEQLEQFPQYLYRPLLCVAALTHRSRLIDMNDDVFLYAKDRYFVDEAVEVVISSQRRSATVVEVLAPESSENVLLYRYVVREIEQMSTSTVDACRVGRRRGVLTRDRCKLFLKKHCHCDTDGIWRVKAKYAKQFNLNEAKFEVICGGRSPSFVVSVAKKKPTAQLESDSDAENANGISSDENDEDKAIREAQEAHKRRKAEQRAEARKEKKMQKETAVREQKPVKASPSQKALIKEKKRQDRLMARQAKKDELKKKADEDRAKKKEEREKLKEEKRRQEEVRREWSRIREDLECEDLKDLPKPVPIQSAIPSEAVGDALCVLEFLACFKPVFDFDVPDNLSFGTLAESVNDDNIDGMYYDIVCELLEAVFRMQELEETESSEDDGKQLLDADAVHNMENVSGSRRELVRAATIASQWPVLNFGLPLRKFQVDSYTVSELVRLHLLGSGFERLQETARFDYQQRGGYDSVDDPALDFRRQDMTVLKTLAETSIFNLSPVDKLKILLVLMNQLLTFASCRDYIDECAEKLKQVQRSLRAHQYAEIKRDRDEAQFWWRKKMEQNMKEQEKSADENDIVCNGSIPADVEEVRGESKEEKRKAPKQKKVQLTDRDYEEMPTENLDWEKISAEEKERMKDWARRKEKELVEQASELQFSTAICPLGRDRTYRRYWVFRTIPGLFVEDDEQHVSDDCFQPCEQLTPEVAVENNSAGDVNNKDDDRVVVENAEVSCSESQTSKNDISEPCAVTVHEQISTRNSVPWSVFIIPEDVQRLVAALNPRGVRESALKQIISDQSSQISDFISRCDVDAFRGHEPAPSLTADSQKVAEQKLEKSLRDALLDLEERIFTGNLGSLKATSRMDWRTAVSESRYDPQCSSLILTGTQIDMLRSSDTPVSETDESSESSCNLSELKTPRSSIRELAMAMLQIEQMVESRYLNPPLGDDEETKKQKQKALIDAAFKLTVKTENTEKNNSNGNVDGLEDSADEGSMASVDVESGVKKQRTSLERWEESLMLSTSLSQLWVHCSVLETSVAWSRSSLHAYCRICRRKGDGEHMLLCDACDRGHHMYCLKPPVKMIPEGDWFCPSCRPKEILPRTPRKSFTEFSSIEDSESDEEVTQESIASEMEAEVEGEDTAASMSATETEDYPATADEDDEAKNEQIPSRVRLPGGGKKSASTSRASSVSAEPPKSAGSGRRSGIDTSVTYNRRQMKATAATAANVSIDGDQGSVTSSTAAGRRSTGNNREQRKPKPAAAAAAATPAVETVKRKISSEWDDYELDSKRMSLTTKSRYSLAENSLKICEDLVTELMHQDDAWPFLKPVTKKEALDYFDVIKHPMDFARIRNKINRFEYNTADEILDDVRLIFSNCFTYNNPSTVVAIAGGELQRYFERRIHELNLVDAKSATGSNMSGVTNGRKRKRTTL